MDGKTLARIGAVIFVAVAVTATAVEMTRKEEKREGAASLAAPPALSPLRWELRRCQILGEAALLDGGCLRLWAEQRDRFVGSAAPSFGSEPKPIASPAPNANTQEAR
ncbi:MULTISPECIES: putative entry exclusion protein TrbK-alt [unclassified Mesorhizobium]|uniref:putative entry exclusion protein TrbK-alt n=1 Tax=unclassified Mesorhizobium TaxID=325217 RepID=UPI000FCB9DF4|nr:MULTISPECIES: putative entry exclusion protein TrbK-alt [unclassified Mesorhizobium]RUV26110.1 conjugal transfer protein TrbK [Mesorhizobium sp. M1A.F.Ca.IN.022.04.1.1]RWG31483.1 MAG: conjugal transfer protein TrbK [Mesorhizobium sp.]